ncbi:MAG: hypothetical protein ABIP06_02300 [Pyrinomonadaceae bacterium]
MKTKLFLLLVLMLAFSGLFAAQAQTRQEQKVQIHKQKNFSRSKLTVRFVSLVEDSRCPKGTQCIWAGNAKIKIEVSNRGRNKEMFEINTNTGAKGATYDRYQIELLDLIPVPASNVRINKNGYVATLAVTRLTR